MRSDIIAETKHIAKSKKPTRKNSIRALSRHRKSDTKTQEQDKDYDDKTPERKNLDKPKVWKSVLRTYIPAKPTIVTCETLLSEGWSEDVLNAMKQDDLKHLLDCLTQHRWLFENKYE